MAPRLARRHTGRHRPGTTGSDLEPGPRSDELAFARVAGLAVVDERGVRLILSRVNMSVRHDARVVSATASDHETSGVQKLVSNLL